MTHHTEWVAFNRATQNKKTFPMQLSNMLLKNKNDLFKVWMECGRNWDKVTMQVDRSIEQKNKAKSGWVAVQGKNIKKDWTGVSEKLETLLKSRFDTGMYYDDPDFPGDADETYSPGSLLCCLFMLFLPWALKALSHVASEHPQTQLASRLRLATTYWAYDLTYTLHSWSEVGCPRCKYRVVSPVIRGYYMSPAVSSSSPNFNWLISTVHLFSMPKHPGQVSISL